MGRHLERCDAAMAPAVGDGLRGIAPLASGTPRHRRRGCQGQGCAIADESIETTSHVQTFNPISQPEGGKFCSEH